MKIAMVGTYPLDPDVIRGGVEYVMKNLVEGLRTNPELEIHVISSRTDVAQARTVRVRNVTWHYLPSSRRIRTLTFGWADHRRVRRILRALGPDVIHFQNAPTYAYPYGVRPPACPVLLTLHGIIHHEVNFPRPKRWLPRFRNVLRAAQERQVLRKVRHLVTLNSFVEHAIRSLTSATMHRIDNPVDARYFGVKDATVEGRVLFVGFVSRLKNVMALLQAVALLRERYPRIKACIAGAANDPEYLREVQQYLDEQGLHAHVDLLGQLPEDRLLEEYAKCALLASTSLWENSPIAVQQAMAAGKPVVANRVGGVPDLIRNGTTGFKVEVNDIEGLADRIGALLGDPALRERMGKAAKVEAAERFAPEAVADKTFRLYQELLAQARKGARA